MSISIQQLKTALDAIREAVCLLDTEGKPLWSNDAMRKLAGKQPDDPIENVACSELLKGITSCHRPNCPFVRMMESRRRANGTVSLRERWFNVFVDPLLNEPLDCPFWSMIFKACHKKEPGKRTQEISFFMH